MTELSPCSHLNPKNNYKDGSGGMLVPNVEGKVCLYVVQIHKSSVAIPKFEKRRFMGKYEDLLRDEGGISPGQYAALEV